MNTIQAQIAATPVPPTTGTVVDTEGREINVVYSDGSQELAGLDAELRQVARSVQAWAERSRSNGVESMIERRAWRVSENPFEQMAEAHWTMGAIDVVAATVELVEGVAYDGVKWELGDDQDTTDVWNQMAAEQNLDDVIRKCSRETFACSQVIVGAWWDWATFKVRGMTDKGNKKKTTKRVWYPSIVTVLDPTKVVPVGMLAFGQERLAWMATPMEWEAFQDFMAAKVSEAPVVDEIMTRFYLAPYVPTALETSELIKLGVDVSRLILLNPELVRRHTLTKSDYERFAPVRLRSVFRLVDMRQQLMESDRVALVGAANYIMLVKKGDKDLPASTPEIANLKANFRTVAKVPIIFSDHRLSIEIITPKQEFVLQKEKYDLIDQRILAALLNTIASNTRGGDAQSTATIGKPVADTLDGRRHMLGRFLEKLLAREVIRHPNNAGLNIDRAPSLVFVPAVISLIDDAAMRTALVNLRATRDVSRESTLEAFGLSQDAEYGRVKKESEQYDDIFQTHVPFDSANGTPPGAQGPAGGQGGRPDGGGTPKKNAAKVKTSPTGNTSPKGS